MFQYIRKLYSQCISIYKIKKQLQLIQNVLPTHTTIDDLFPDFAKLKQLIFNCGSIYIKFLQWYISKLKSNIIENDNTLETLNMSKFISYFEDIFENCPHHSIEHTKQIFKQSLDIDGVKLDDYIDISTMKVIASGSIGQVYWATRKSDGLEIAIKVKHPDIANDLEAQFSIIKLYKFLQSFNYIKKRYTLIFNIDDFLFDIMQQCDFRIEASNCNKFRENFIDSKDFIVFPDVIYQSADVLITNYIPSIPLETLTPIQYYNITINFVCFFYQMLFVDNFIHGDLHCKNWKVKLSATGKPQLIIFDCGICFSNIDKQLTNDFWFSLAKYDIEQLSITLEKFIIITNTISDSEILIYTDMRQIITNIFNNILKDSLSISLVLKSIIQFFTSHNFIIHKFLINLSILICVIEEFFKKSDIINRDKPNPYNINMFEIINDNQLDIIAFCNANKCYPKVAELFNAELDNKFIEYKKNLANNNINDIKPCNNQPVLFSTLGLTTLKFKIPE